MDRPDLSRNAFSAPVFPSTGDILYAEPTSEDNKADPKRRRSTRRKKTLLALLDELEALKSDDELEQDTTPNPEIPAAHAVHERIKNNPIIVDRKLQDEGAGMFMHFQKRIRQVDTELLNFGNAVRPLGSSVGLISSAWHLRVRLQQILHLFHENAADIFPQKVKHEQGEAPPPLSSRKKTKTRTARRNPQDPRLTRTIRPGMAHMTSELDAFPNQFRLFAKDLVAFLHFLHDIPEFTDEELNASVLSFEADLKYWACCLDEFENQFQLPSTKRYINDLTREMDDHLESIRDALRIFVKDGVSTIHTAQKHTQSGLQNLSTVATFFSGVTASTLQYTQGAPTTGLGRVVNCLWISSLVFSIASAINSQLAYHWRAAMYRSPRSAVPWWVSIWLTRTPLVFLVAAVMAFSIGLVCYTHSSGQGYLVIICTTIFTVVTSMALLAVAVWFAFERLVFSKTKGSKWLWDIIHDHRTRFLRRTGMTWINNRMGRLSQKIRTRFTRAKSKVVEMSEKVVASVVVQRDPDGTASTTDRDSIDSPDSPVLPTINPNSSPVHTHKRRRSDVSIGSVGSRGPMSLSPVTPTIFEGKELVQSPIEPSPDTPFPAPILSREPTGSNDLHITLADPPAFPSVATSPARWKFQQIVRRVVQSRALVQPEHKTGGKDGPIPPPAQRRATVVSVPDMSQLGSSRRAQSYWSIAIGAVRPPRISLIIPALRQLRASQFIDAHHGLVRHLQFSPDGKWLATCSWDRTAIIWKVGNPFSLHRTLGHGTIGFVGQVAWSPSGTYLLTKLLKSVRVWTPENGACIKHIRRSSEIQAVTWLPDGKSFASVELDHVFILDLEGNVLKEHDFAHKEIHDVAFTNDSKRMLLVGTLMESQQGLKPKKSRAEKRIIAYDLTDDSIENQVPVLEEVRDITLTGDGEYALVSYEDTSPPELWRVAMIQRAGDAEREARLTLVHTYIPATTVRFAGPSYFGGSRDQLVICAGDKGDIHIWDRESGLLLHTLQANLTPGDDGGNLTGIAWNHNSPGQFMFASATHDGTVRIWTAPTMPETQPPSRTESPTPGPKAGRRDAPPMSSAAMSA